MQDNTHSFIRIEHLQPITPLQENYSEGKKDTEAHKISLTVIVKDGTWHTPPSLLP